MAMSAVGVGTNPTSHHHASSMQYNHHNQYQPDRGGLGAPPQSMCGGAVTSRRGLLASLWSLSTLLVAIAFLIALIFTLSVQDSDDQQYYYYDNKDENYEYLEPELALTSRAMAFAALWTAVLSALMAIFGTVILGWQSPTGQYYTCCSSRVHKTTPLALGSFIGALLMFANLTLVCAVLFGEFEIRDYQRGEYQRGENEEGHEQDRKDTVVHRSSMAFSIMCVFLTVLYAGFASVTFFFSESILSEMDADEFDDNHMYYDETRGHPSYINRRLSKGQRGFGYDGYIGERFDVIRGPNSGFVAPTIPNGTLT